MRLFDRKEKATRPRAPTRLVRYEVPIVVEDNDPLKKLYREFLADPIKARMDYTKDCILGATDRKECTKAQLLMQLNLQYREDEPEAYSRGIPGPDREVFNALEVGCRVCILYRCRPGSWLKPNEENVFIEALDENGVEVLEPTGNDAHETKGVLRRTLGSWKEGLTARVRGKGESKEEPIKRPPKVRYRELASKPEPPGEDPGIVGTVQGPEPPAEPELKAEPEPAPREETLDTGGNQAPPTEPHTLVGPQPVAVEEPTPKPKAGKKTKKGKASGTKKVPAKKKTSKKDGDKT